MQTLDRIGPDFTIGITGMGALGFAALMMARVRGAGRIVAVDKVVSGSLWRAT